MTVQLTDMLNSMRTGRTYGAATFRGASFIGEYLGYEVVHDQWSILLKCDDITVSLPLDDLDTVLPSAHGVARISD